MLEEQLGEPPPIEPFGGLTADCDTLIELVYRSSTRARLFPGGYGFNSEDYVTTFIFTLHLFSTPIFVLRTLLSVFNKNEKEIGCDLGTKANLLREEQSRILFLLEKWIELVPEDFVTAETEEKLLTWRDTWTTLHIIPNLLST
ncbi:hypothetical protein Pelo_4804 [Pelomyxa schiedti]|nr:hypothetical protein Pelo_4804 [Pelomyxa schiedti]